MSGISALKRCTSYCPGHSVHWIQALHTANKPEVAAGTRAGRLLAVDGARLLIDFGGERPEAFLNHDTPRLLAIAGRLPRGVTVNDQYAILRVGSHCFSVLAEDRGPLGACPNDELTDDRASALARRVETHGGFSVRLR